MQDRKAEWQALARIALEAATAAGAQYADVRIAGHRNQFVFARNERIASIDDRTTAGIGVRCLASGAWGFASSAVLTPDSVRRIAQQAAEIARASALAKQEDVVLAEEAPHLI